jgi:ATP-dependent DNA ligase
VVGSFFVTGREFGDEGACRQTRSGPDWLHEIRHDGFRILARRDADGVRLSPYRSGRSKHWVKVKNPAAPAVRREAEKEWCGARRKPRNRVTR